MIGYWGLSNHTGWQVVAMDAAAQSAGHAAPVTMQPQYNLLAREIEWEIVPACEHLGIGLLPWSPLGGGWLTGKYRAGQRPEGATRLGENPSRGVEAYDARAARAQTWSVLDALERIASLRDASVAQVALAWVHDRPAVSSVILGARTVTQLRDNLDAAGLHLTEDETRRLDEASEPACDDYPYGRIGREMRSRGAS
jgi:aryl-alcohol dehydrogenase-like predicted oxidoreductase